MGAVRLGPEGRDLAAKKRTIVQARNALREAEDRAVLEINTRFRKLEEARALLRVAGVAQEAAREKVRVGTNRYQVQAALLADVLQHQSELASANDRYQQALLAVWTARADFEQAVGEEIKP